MAEFLHFSRDSRLYMEKDGYLWLVPVLDGFSFSQATNASEITLNEMEDATGRSRRGRKMFTDSLSPAEYSFSTYIRPFKAAATGSLDGGGSATTGAKAGFADSTARHHAVEEALWVAMAGQNVYVPSTGSWTHKAAGGAITSISSIGAAASARTAGTYTIAVPSAGAVISGGASQNGANAVLKVVVNGSGAATVTVTERGTNFLTGNTITIADSLLGGGGAAALTMVTNSSSAVTDGNSLDINFFDSNRSSLGTFNLYFVLSDRTAGRLLYRVKDAVVNEASIDFDIDGIATVNWSGMGGKIEEVGTGTGATQFTAGTAKPTATGVGNLWIDTANNDSLYIATAADANSWWHAIEEGAADTGNFIRNRLTQLTLAPEAAFRAGTTFTDSGDGSTSYEASYSVALTGGNVTISNNISYLTPEELGSVNQPIEHVTGTRTITGSATCYLGSSDAATNRSKNLFADLVADNTTVINKFAITLDVGGTAGVPRFSMTLPTAHLEIPSHSIEDVISLETNFHGLGSGVGEGDEISLKYVGP